MPTSHAASNVSFFVTKVTISGVTTSYTASGVAVFIAEVTISGRKFLVSFSRVASWVVDFGLLKSRLCLQIIAISCFLELLGILGSLAASEGGFAMGVVEASLLLQLLVVVVLNPLWSLLVLLILLFGDFGLRLLVSIGFGWCRNFWPVVLSVVTSFVAL